MPITYSNTGLKQFPRNNSSHQRTQHSASPTRDGGWQKNQMYNQNQHYQTVQSSMYSEVPIYFSILWDLSFPIYILDNFLV